MIERAAMAVVRDMDRRGLRLDSPRQAHNRQAREHGTQPEFDTPGKGSPRRGYRVAAADRDAFEPSGNPLTKTRAEAPAQ